MPDQTVVAGETQDLDALAAEMATLYPNKRGVRLNTEGAFHTYLMVSAAQEFRNVLEQTEFGALGVDTLSNYTGKLHESASNAIRSRLFFQLFNPVKWVSCINTAVDAGVDTDHRARRRHREGRRSRRQAAEPREHRQEVVEVARASSTIPARDQRGDDPCDGRAAVERLTS